MVYDLDFNQFIWNMELVDLGVVPSTRPPNCPDSFCYDIPNFGNVTALGVHAPPPMRFSPPMGNPGSATGCHSHVEVWV